MLSCDLIVYHLITRNVSEDPKLRLLALDHCKLIHTNGSQSQHCSISG